ncbi:MAG: hypothetical protein P1U87_07355 [Verrucomicrobiales bacterium]|nr:hypothetical protein [Verrucomicrobiales bacterium]
MKSLPLYVPPRRESLSFSFSLFGILPLVVVAAFAFCPAVAEDSVPAQERNLPYHPLVYHLDLCVLAYQFHGQSLAWSFDPFFEESNNLKWDRAKFIKRTQLWAKAKGTEQTNRDAGLDAYRGPGILSGFPDNPSHDPIIYRYDRIRPSSDSIVNAGKLWIEYRTPEAISGKIGEVYVCYRPAGKPAGAITITQVLSREETKTSGRDILVAFEGGTGDKGEPGQPPSQSLMGFVLLRHWSDQSDNFDVHIAFRGSRSGSAGRAVAQSLSDQKAHGNPDWITDLGTDLLASTGDGGVISTRGNVSRGFATSMESILPQAFGALSKLAELKPGRSPERIFVTGHSLGGALTQHFVSAVLLGNQYGPSGAGVAMPTSMREWPWQNIKMISFSAPRSGDALWASNLTTECLASDFFSKPVGPVDREAFAVTHPEILPRLLDTTRPAGYRVLNSKDPVTSGKLPVGKHVGKTVYVNTPKFADLISMPAFSAHEPSLIRDDMVESLGNRGIPENSWRYLKMEQLNPTRSKSRRGSVEEFTKLRDTIDKYHRDRGHDFDQVAFQEDFEIYLSILKSQ